MFPGKQVSVRLNRSQIDKAPSPVASDGMGQTKNNNIVSREYHVAVSVEFDGDGMGQTNNNNIVPSQSTWI